MKPQIQLITNSFSLGTFYGYSPISASSSWQIPSGYQWSPTTFDADMAASNLPRWWDADNQPTGFPTGVTSEGVCYTNILSPSTAKKFFIATLLNQDVYTVGVGTGATQYDSYDNIVDFHVQFISDFLIGEKGISPGDIMYCTGYALIPATYGEYDFSDSDYKSAVEINCNHNLAICIQKLKPKLETLGCFVADTFFDLLNVYPMIQAYSDYFLDLDSGGHMSTKRGSEWSDRFLKPYLRRWLK